MQFDHIGVPAAAKRDGMRFLESKRLWLTSPGDHPYRVEWLWYEPGSPEAELIRTVRTSPTWWKASRTRWTARRRSRSRSTSSARSVWGSSKSTALRLSSSSLTELAAELVRIDSVNPDLVPGGAGEGELARFVAEWLADAGLEVEVEEVAPGRPNVVGRARGTGGGPTLLLNAHMDTVGYQGMEAPLEPRVENGRLYGRGAYDMKGSLAAIMVAGAEAVRASLRGDVLVAAVADEEVYSIGAEAVARGCRADAAIVAEPTELRVVVAHKGFVWMEVETTGRAAHGSRPDLGEDAIVAMGHVLSASVRSQRHSLPTPHTRSSAAAPCTRL